MTDDTAKRHKLILAANQARVIARLPARASLQRSAFRRCAYSIKSGARCHRERDREENVHCAPPLDSRER